MVSPRMATNSASTASSASRIVADDRGRHEESGGDLEHPFQGICGRGLVRVLVTPCSGARREIHRLEETTQSLVLLGKHRQGLVLELRVDLADSLAQRVRVRVDHRSECLKRLDAALLQDVLEQSARRSEVLVDGQAVHDEPGLGIHPFCVQDVGEILADELAGAARHGPGTRECTADIVAPLAYRGNRVVGRTVREADDLADELQRTIEVQGRRRSQQYDAPPRRSGTLASASSGRPNERRASRNPALRRPAVSPRRQSPCSFPSPALRACRDGRAISPRG